MYRFGLQSLTRLRTCHADIQRVAHRALAISPLDFSVVHGYRNQVQQDALFEKGASQRRWPDSKHNHRDVLGDPCALALDVAPYLSPGWIPWGEGTTHGHSPAQQLRYWDILAGTILAAAGLESVSLRWGGDWDRDTFLADNKFNDLGHFELVTN